MRFERFNRAVIPRQFRLGQSRMYFVVANLMQQNDGTTFASAQFRDQVVKALTHVRRDGPVAKWADGIAHDDQSISGPAGTMPRGLRSSEGEK